jgi:hypothetical protein
MLLGRGLNVLNNDMEELSDADDRTQQLAVVESVHCHRR